MKELNHDQQPAISRLVREWITFEPVRRYIRHLLALTVDPHVPQEHQALLNDLEARRSEGSNGTPVKEGPGGMDGGRPKHGDTN